MFNSLAAVLPPPRAPHRIAPTLRPPPPPRPQDAAAQRALNVFPSRLDASATFSLYGLMARGRTAMGKRRLRAWLKQVRGGVWPCVCVPPRTSSAVLKPPSSPACCTPAPMCTPPHECPLPPARAHPQPLVDPAEVNGRLDVVEALAGDVELRERLRDQHLRGEGGCGRCGVLTNACPPPAPHPDPTPNPPAPPSHPRTHTPAGLPDIERLVRKLDSRRSGGAMSLAELCAMYRVSARLPLIEDALRQHEGPHGPALVARCAGGRLLGKAQGAAGSSGLARACACLSSQARTLHAAPSRCPCTCTPPPPPAPLHRSLPWMPRL